MAILKLAPRSKPKTTPPRKRADWDAIHRDYRTGKFTLRELKAKHGADNGLISRKAKAEGWTQDLSAVIRQETNARLAEALVDSQVIESHQKVIRVIDAAAAENVSIITGHRTRLLELAIAVDKAKDCVLLLGASVTCIREAAVFMQAVGNLAAATKVLIEMERRTHNLDDSKHQTAQNDLAALLDTLAEQGSRLPTSCSSLSG